MSALEAVPGRHPNAAEWRMICAMTQDAVIAAVRHGQDSVSFHGYCITARCVGWIGESGDLVEVKLSIGCGACPVDGALIEVARDLSLGSACLIEPIPACRVGPLPDRVSRWLCQPD